MPGRPPLPPNLKVLNGRRDGKDSGGRDIPETPEFERGAPPVPIWLDPEAVAEWNRVVPVLTNMGLLKAIDMASLAAYCECWARFKNASLIVQQEGMVLHDDKQGRAQRHPALLTVEAASKELRSWAQQFGLTPSAEARLGRKKDDGGDEANPFAGAA